jgi:hypothetical protein
MSEPLVITIPHRLGKDEALKRVQPALGTVSRTFPAIKVEEEVWSGHRMTFRVRALNQVASGTVTIEDDYVRLEAVLPWLLHRFAQAIQKTVAGRAKVLLEKK